MRVLRQGMVAYVATLKAHATICDPETKARWLGNDAEALIAYFQVALDNLGRKKMRRHGLPAMYA